MRPLQGKTVLITGGTAGIGKACAEAMLAAGAEAVVLNGRNRERGERALAELAVRFPERGSLLRSATWRNSRRRGCRRCSHRKLGRIDVLVNSTGTNDFPTLLHRIELEDIPASCSVV